MYPGDYIEEIPSDRTITGVSTSVTAFIGVTERGPTNEGVQVCNFGDFERDFGGLVPGSDVSYAVQQFFTNGGTEAWVVRVAPGRGDFIGDRATGTGIYALQDVDIFNIMCLPNVSDNAVLEAALAYCDERRAFLLIDVPESIDTVDKAKQWLTASADLRGSNSAAYFPRIVAADPLQHLRLRPFPPSGAVAGVFARTDSAQGVWKAPAGTDAALRGVEGLTYKLSDLENGALNALGLNALRTFTGFGNVVWGARTLDGSDARASEWKYIPVRRLALLLEESVSRGTEWAVFEPNDEPLWAQIRRSVGAFMHHLFRGGAFQGQTPRAAYFVKCDQETTTQNDIDLGIVNIVVGFAPLLPAEFVIIKIQQCAGRSRHQDAAG